MKTNVRKRKMRPGRSRVRSTVSKVVTVGGALALAFLMSNAPRGSTARYEVVHGWPQVPAGFSFGHVPGVAVDSHGHVWVFHRGIRPIMAFEAATGRFVT